MSDRVALIGVGAMGRALLVRLRAAGKEVQAYDVAPVGLQDARSGGTIASASAAAAAHAAVYVHVLLRAPVTAALKQVARLNKHAPVPAAQPAR